MNKYHDSQMSSVGISIVSETHFHLPHLLDDMKRYITLSCAKTRTKNIFISRHYDEETRSVVDDDLQFPVFRPRRNKRRSRRRRLR